MARLPRHVLKDRAVAFLKKDRQGRSHPSPPYPDDRPVVQIYFDPSRGRDSKARISLGCWSFPDWALGPHGHTNALAIEFGVHADSKVVHRPANLPTGVEAHRR